MPAVDCCVQPIPQHLRHQFCRIKYWLPGHCRHVNRSCIQSKLCRSRRLSSPGSLSSQGKMARMKYDGDGRASARFFSDGMSPCSSLLRRLTRRGITLPVVSVPRPAGTGRALYRSGWRR